MTRRSGAVLLGALGALAVGGALLAEPPLRLAAIAAGLALFFGAASVGGVAGRAADALDGLHDRPVQVRVWGQPLPGGSGEGFQLLRLRAVGAGLHLQLRSRSGDGSTHELKVAQPQEVAVDAAAGRATIPDAKYVQWRRQRLPRTGSAGALPALELELLAVREGGDVPPLLIDHRAARGSEPAV